ncbi:elongation factor P 5-aminopentanone reductase [Clostridium cylindrosporum]|uniref:3-oxoacyl-[acyl-carrier-protein] reductase FabG n=1 Tax=Clostridium cylindrosporum DSM 605 TaxID=1121307 RepID=A0A0J8DE17_CLOCY|nr:SDR family oxidoreductase [Clostridium cylindrosporum]KMT22458.1 3-oxoacyl-[acyl-carrier-protein] reductase FabG [Clostridium cylindrosporum DSM 605]
MNCKTVLITGASRGIGAACAKLFSEKGYNVVINYNNSEDEALSLCESLENRGYSAKVFKANVCSREEVNSMIDFCIRNFGSIDVLINNAGISQEKLFIDITDEDWDNMMNSNLKSMFYCSQKALEYMISEKKGKIINISSMWGMVGASCEVHYSVAKAGVIGMTKALAKEVGPSNIQVNAVAPGVIQTDMLKGFTEDDLNDLKYETPLMRLGTPEDVAKCVYFLASDDSDFITGQVISPNGGFVI